MAEAKKDQKPVSAKLKVVPSYAPFYILSQSVELPIEGGEVERDGWVEANIERGLLRVCS